MNYYERHIGDYLKDTAHLSLLEHGVYGRLLDVYYTRESALPDAQVARLIGARSKDEIAAMRAVLSEFFMQDESGAWIQPRCEREIARFQDKQRKASASANARWSARRPQSEGNANASPDAMRTHSEGNAPNHQTPDTTLASVDAEVGAAKPRRPARKCPADFVVTEELTEWARREVPSVAIGRETDRMRDHTFSKAISDWPGAWRNWMRRAADGRATVAGTARQAEVAKWLPQAKPSGEIIEMEVANGSRIAMG